MPNLQKNEPVRYNKYYVCTEHTCSNRNQIYEWRLSYQSCLRQVLNNPTLLPLFSLNSKPHLELDIYYRLKQWAAQGEDYIWDNKEELEDYIAEETHEKQAVSEVYLTMRE